MKTFQRLGISVITAAYLAAPLLFAASGGSAGDGSSAADSHGGGGSGGHAASGAAKSAGPQSHGPGSTVHTFSVDRNPANFQASFGLRAPARPQPHIISPFIQTTPSIPSRNIFSARSVPQVTAPPAFAFGGRSLATAEARRAEFREHAEDHAIGGWDRTQDRIWHGRHYHWNHGAWVILNDGYYPFGASYYVASSSDVAPNASYEYDSAAPSSTFPPPASAVPAPAPMPAVPEESIAADVQESLQRRGYYHGEITGVISDTTRGAIADFQKNNDLPITGYITKSLLKALGL